jgi:hypothetical protein
LIEYYAVAVLPDGRFGQLLVKRGGGLRVQEWTGVVYRTKREANMDVARLNGLRGVTPEANTARAPSKRNR